MKLLLDDFGVFLGRKRKRFIVKKKGAKSELAAEDVESILFTCPGVAVSASALRLAVENGIQVVFASYGGYPYGFLMPTGMSGSVKARREQFLAYNDERGFVLARGFVLGKLLNQSSLLKLMAKNRKQNEPSLAERLYEAGGAVEDIAKGVSGIGPTNVDEARQALMKLEAEAARAYWAGVASILPVELGFSGRKTRGARDPFNAMLNFGYQKILFPEVWRAVVYAGLDPYAGYLHADRPGKPSLVLDLMEEFRQQAVDRVILSLVTRGTIKAGEVLAPEAPGGRVLSRETTRVLLESLEVRLADRVVFNGVRGTLRNAILFQARQVSRLLLRETGRYAPFHLGW